PAAVTSPLPIAALVIASEHERIAVRSVVRLRIEGNTLALRPIGCCVPLTRTEFPQYNEHSTLSPVAIRDEATIWSGLSLKSSRSPRTSCSLSLQTRRPSAPMKSGLAGRILVTEESEPVKSIIEVLTFTGLIWPKSAYLIFHNQAHDRPLGMTRSNKLIR